MQDIEHGIVYRCGVYTISPAERRLFRDGDRVDLEAKVFDLILLLVENRNRALSKQEVIDALWGQRPVTDTALSQLLYKARRALDDDGERQDVIRTVYGRGPQWVAPVVEEPAEAAMTATTPTATPDTTPDREPSPAPAITDEPTPVPLRRRHRRLAAGMLAVAGLLLALWFIPRSFAPPVSPPPRVAILPMTNDTGDASLDWTARGLPGLIASLLDGNSGLDVVDPLQAGRASGIAPSQGRSQAEQIRYITRANLLIDGKLEKLTDNLYQLTLHLDEGRPEDASDIVITGGDPSAIALAAMPRLRHALALEPPASTTLSNKPKDAYLAETFARGIDMAAHGDSQAAQLHFALVVEGEPDFLPGRYQLARAQLRTDQHTDATTTLRRLFNDAVNQKQPAMAALALDEQAYLAQQRHAYADALTLLDRARPYAEQANRPEALAAIALGATKAQASLHQLDAAEREWQVARELIEKNGLHQLEPHLHNSAIFIANSRRDFVALEAAARAGLAANEALGDEHNSMGAILNIAYAMNGQGRDIEALPLWARVWHWAREHKSHQMQSLAGSSLAHQLSAAGLDDHATTINDILMEEARRLDDRNLRSLALAFRAGIELDGNPVQALRTAREASALIDAANNPNGMSSALLNEAYIAYIAEPSALAAINQRIATLVDDDATPAQRFPRQQVLAMTAAAAGDLPAALAALETAASLAHSVTEQDSLRQIALHIALQTDDAAIAAFGLRDADPDKETDVTRLRQISEWADRHGDQATRERAAAREAQLRQATLDALADITF